MIDIADYCSPGLRFWTSSFTVTDVYVNSCQRRGVTITLGGGTSSQETTGNQWGSGCGKVHGVLPIRSFSKSIQDACGVGTVWDELTQTCIVNESACGWQPDGNGDNLIGVNDLLDLLGVYGDSDYDQDGIWDSADDCVGEYDECGVCNGSGPSIPIIESIEILYDSLYAEQIDEWWVFEVGADTTYQFVCDLVNGCMDQEATNFDPEATVDDGSCVFAIGCENETTLAYNGTAYPLVEIENTCWFQVNLQTSSFSDGLPIVHSRISEHGRIYPYHVINSPNGLCPVGWHVSSDSDWKIIEQAHGMDILHLDSLGNRGENELVGHNMKAENIWDGGGENIFMFSALPSSIWNADAQQLTGFPSHGYWWCEDSLLVRRLSHGSNGVTRFISNNPEHEYSVRCVRNHSSINSE